MAPTTTLCGNVTVTQGAASASEQTRENAGKWFFLKLLGLSKGVILELGKL